MAPLVLEPALAHVLTGGGTSVSAGAAWMRAAVDTARRLVAGAERGGYAVIGTCLGSQILAEALRPGSIVDAATIEVGLTMVRRCGDDGARRVVPAYH
ncbi:MAG TPA: hypothetical protein VIA06_09695 [Candidatus Dormibacteraeota bacterium]|jgi:GMP synthase-like glutamine amidotransferase|nr:hypothetical protein [Candidatus Dormibacteraeota bacterium]